MKKLLILIGLPGSGKTTLAKQIIEDPSWKRVNKDDLRAMINDYKFSPENEKLVHDLSISIIKKLLREGYNVVVDNTHIQIKHRQCYYLIAEEVGDVEVSEQLVDLPLEACLHYNATRIGHAHVPEDVIRNMAKKLHPASLLSMCYPMHSNKLIAHDDHLQDIIVCDIDGTLADMNDRDPYDGKNVDKDTVRWPTLDLLKSFLNNPPYNYLIFFITGRSNICEEQTRCWLNKYFEPSDYILLMRHEGDHTKDNILKKQIYERYIKGKYNVIAWFEDRLRVAQMVHNEGLPLFRVGDPSADF